MSIASNSFLTLAKLVIGLLTHTVSVMSEAIHSASDLVASLLAYFAIRTAEAPADVDHPYGHGKAENLSALVQGILIFAGAIVVIVEAVAALIRRHELQVGPAIVLMLVSAGVNVILSTYLLRTAKRTESPALKADGYHLLSDVWTSLGVLAGLFLVRQTGSAIFDSIAAFAVSILIIRTSWHLVRESVQPLMDASLPSNEEAKIREILASHPAVRSYHKLRTRRGGRERHVDVHVQLPDSLTLIEAHQITEALEERAREAFPDLQITIHFEPYEAELLHQKIHHDGE